MALEMKYITLCEEFLSVAQLHINENALKRIKHHFTHDINSTRKFNQITDIRALVEVLEKRDNLNSNNIDPLLYISNNFLNDFELQAKLKSYKTSLESIPYSQVSNTYYNYGGNAEKSMSESNTIEDNASEISIKEDQLCSQKLRHEETNFSNKELALQQILLSHISERIGHAWRDTARYLGMPEYQIDAIQNKYAFNLREQSYEALKLYIHQCPTDYWKRNLLQALERARRRDLKELAEELITGLNR